MKGDDLPNHGVCFRKPHLQNTKVSEDDVRCARSMCDECRVPQYVGNSVVLCIIRIIIVLCIVLCIIQYTLIVGTYSTYIYIYHIIVMKI